MLTRTQESTVTRTPSQHSKTLGFIFPLKGCGIRTPSFSPAENRLLAVRFGGCSVRWNGFGFALDLATGFAFALGFQPFGNGWL